MKTSTMVRVGLVVLIGCKGEGPDPTDPEELTALPVGESTWSGSLEVAGITLDVEATVTNDDGDLSGTVELDQTSPIGPGSFSITGTYEPTSQRIALAPRDWLVEPTLVTPELVGFSGTFDPVAGTITGTAQDYASGEDNTLTGGPATFTVTGSGASLEPGDGALALPTGNRTFTGTMQCTGLQREVEGTLDYDGVGDVTGTLTFGDPTLADGSATFEFTGVHNPTTGGITLVPGLYTDTDPSFVSFFIEGAYDPGQDRFTGALRQNVGACPANLWQVAF